MYTKRQKDGGVCIEWYGRELIYFHIYVATSGRKRVGGLSDKRSEGNGNIVI